MTAKTNTERQAAYRARKADANLPEVRGIFAAPEMHLAIKAAAAKLARKASKAQAASSSSNRPRTFSAGTQCGLHQIVSLAELPTASSVMA
jgi:uncharacterized MAPEG superfamily protein